MGAFRETFVPLRNRNLRVYLSGQAVSLIGTWMQNTAQSWVVWRLTGSEASLGTVGMLGTLPLLLLGPVAGGLADRWERRRILITTQAIAMLLALVLALLVLTGRVEIWHVYLLATLLGCVNALDMPAQQAFIGDLAGMELVRKAVVLNGMIVQISRILGPTLAGLVVKSIGEGPTFLLNSLSFLAVIASLLAVHSYRQQRHAQAQQPGGFMTGLRYTIHEPRVLDLMIFTALITFFGFSNGTVVPAFATETLHGDAGLFGLLMGASGVGSLFSVLLVVPWGQRIRRAGRMLSAAVGVTGLCFALFSFTRIPWLAMAAFFFTGIPIPLVMTTCNGLLQVLAPPHMRARLLTQYLMFSFGLQPIASLWVGWLAEQVGAPVTIRTNGLAMLTIGLLMMLRPGLAAWEPAAALRGGPPRPEGPERQPVG